MSYSDDGVFWDTVEKVKWVHKGNFDRNSKARFPTIRAQLLRLELSDGHLDFHAHKFKFGVRTIDTVGERQGPIFGPLEITKKNLEIRQLSAIERRDWEERKLKE